MVQYSIFQVLLWINQNFLLQDDLVCEGTNLHFTFLSLRGAGPMAIKMESAGQVEHFVIDHTLIYLYKYIAQGSCFRRSVIVNTYGIMLYM